MEQKYYDGTKLLSLNDAQGKKPELYLITTNRTGGKTTYFGRLLINKFLQKKSKFVLLYRFNYEIDNCADKFFTDLKGLFFSNYEMKSERKASGIYHELFLNEKSCGYALSLNSADQIKKFSHLFKDVDYMLFDEFQSETNHYCNDEVKKLISIHTSIARGNGEQVRYVPVFMCGNTVSLINPYYVALGITNRLNSDTNFLRGNGFILEQGFIESASIAQKESGFNRAFINNSYVAYSSENVYLNDSQTFIETPEGYARYICTLKYKGVDYGIKEYDELGIIFCTNKSDSTFPLKISVTTSDHDINYVMLKSNEVIINRLRFLFEHGCFRFKDLLCKEAVLSALSY